MIQFVFALVVGTAFGFGATWWRNVRPLQREAERRANQLRDEQAKCSGLNVELRAVAQYRGKRSVSERELVSAVCQLAVLHAANRKDGIPFGVHDLSQSMERALADVFLHDDTRCGLMEFKAKESGFLTELRQKADVRSPQMEVLATDAGYRSISEMCHFAGIGNPDPSIVVRFVGYFAAWQATAAGRPIAGYIEIDEFMSGFFPATQDSAKYGAAAAEFFEYLKLLESLAPTSPTSTGNSDNRPLLVIAAKRGQAPKIAVVQSLRVLVQYLGERERLRHQHRKTITIKPVYTVSQGGPDNDQKPRPRIRV